MPGASGLANTNAADIAFQKAALAGLAAAPRIVLNDEQQQALAQYVEAGGALIGIHGAGDNSHKWPWYETNLLGAQFSHHPINPQFQKADVQVETAVDSTLTQKLPALGKIKTGVRVESLKFRLSTHTRPSVPTRIVGLIRIWFSRHGSGFS